MRRFIVPLAMKIIRSELKKDKSIGSWYHSWQANIAMEIFDNSEIELEQANIIAVQFLDRLIA